MSMADSHRTSKTHPGARVVPFSLASRFSYTCLAIGEENDRLRKHQ